MAELMISVIGSPEIISAICGLVGLIAGGIITYLTNSKKTNSEVEIAKINSSSNKLEKEIETLRSELKQMTEDYNNIKVKYAKALEDNDKNIGLLKDYENLLRHYRFIFKLAYEMSIPKLQGDSEAVVLLEEVKNMFSEDYKLK